MSGSTETCKQAYGAHLAKRPPRWSPLWSQSWTSRRSPRSSTTDTRGSIGSPGAARPRVEPRAFMAGDRIPPIHADRGAPRPHELHRLGGVGLCHLWCGLRRGPMLGGLLMNTSPDVPL